MSKAKRNTPTHYEASVSRPAPGSLYEFLLAGAAIYRSVDLESSLDARILRERRPWAKQVCDDLVSLGLPTDALRTPDGKRIVAFAAGSLLSRYWFETETTPTLFDMSRQKSEGYEIERRWPKMLCQEIVSGYAAAEGLTSDTNIAERLNAGCQIGERGLEPHHVKRARKAWASNSAYMHRKADDQLRLADLSMQESATLVTALLAVRRAATYRADLRQFRGRALAEAIERRFNLAPHADTAIDILKIVGFEERTQHADGIARWIAVDWAKIEHRPAAGAV